MEAYQKTCIHHTDQQRNEAGCPVCNHRELLDPKQQLVSCQAACAEKDEGLRDAVRLINHLNQKYGCGANPKFQEKCLSTTCGERWKSPKQLKWLLRMLKTYKQEYIDAAREELDK